MSLSAMRVGATDGSLFSCLNVIDTAGAFRKKQSRNA